MRLVYIKVIERDDILRNKGFCSVLRYIQIYKTVERDLVTRLDETEGVSFLFVAHISEELRIVDSSEDFESVFQICQFVEQSSVDDPVDTEIFYKDFGNLDEESFALRGFGSFFLFINDQ